jgi:hypothetical protein
MLKHKVIGTMGVVGLAGLIGGLLVLILPRAAESAPRPSFSEAQAAYESASSDWLSCVRGNGWEADLTRDPTGLFYYYGIGSQGAQPGTSEDEFVQQEMGVSDSCGEASGVQAAHDALWFYVQPTDDELRRIALSCSASLGLRVSWVGRTAEAVLADVTKDEQGYQCATAAIYESIRSKAAALQALSSG